ncbi:hypothetical protein S7711_00782 [Stachybotrys chartarum IBT 7711]|uniref:Tuberous sclerosis 1 n=1 Tax=Stachybotrys chartarum (strain CBS 109288 / IBT 7711) TaxID=1280523 RepID=A0A084B064_STACB|nr:hypothetical protein S7711_00782 [Stachybotrys chartarum IBT 7711]KFA49034.1 hypothetical protein S40293_06182 [Stachybotrys chartarum IBT 40293]
MSPNQRQTRPPTRPAPDSCMHGGISSEAQPPVSPPVSNLECQHSTHCALLKGFTCALLRRWARSLSLDHDLVDTIRNFLAEPTLPLPDDLIETIAAYLQNHHEHDEAAVDRLQEELVSIFEKHVRGEAAATGPWIAIIRRLITVLQTPERIIYWFECFQGTLDHPSAQKKLLLDEVIAGLLDLAKHSDEYQDILDNRNVVSPFIDRLLRIWIDRVYPTHSEGVLNIEYTERMSREALVQFGKKRPKDLFISLDTYLVKKEYRRPALRFLCDFLQSQPPHLHQVLQTPFFNNLLTCLQADTSTSIISAALTALIMLLPHMPTDLVPHLPTLFNIYARLLFWTRERTEKSEASSILSGQTGNWDVHGPDFEDEDLTVAHLSNYYTMLYGLYPINFMDYIRKPHRYLRHANVSDAGAIEVQPSEIRHRSEQFRCRHLLHPNFFSLTIESEKTDFGRWLKSEPPEVMAECMALYMAPEQDQENRGLPGISLQTTGDGYEKEISDPALLGSSVARVDSWRRYNSVSAESISSNRAASGLARHGSQSSHPSRRNSGDIYGDHAVRDASVDSLPLSPKLAMSSSQTQLQDLIQSNKAIKSGAALHQSLTSESLPSLSLSQHESAMDRQTANVAVQAPSITSPASQGAAGNQVLQLQRQILLLQNDLSFERYLKQQHMAHIGELRRRQVVEAATEAEMQNLIITNRSLKSRFEEAKKSEMQVRRESEKSRAMAKKWEADLANKFRSLRDESKIKDDRTMALQRELEELKQETEKLRKIVCDNEVKELNDQQNMQSIEIQVKEIKRLRAEIERLKVLDLEHNVQEAKRQAAMESAAAARSELVQLKLKIAAQENDLQRTRKLYQSQIASLQDRLSEAQERHERPSTSSNPVLQQVLTASREKQAELQKQYDLLLRKHTALQSSLLEMQPSSTKAQGATPSKRESDTIIPTRTNSLGTSSTAGESDTSTCTAVLPPGGRGDATASGGVSLRPEEAASASTETLDPASTTTSMDSRYFGRGGVQNRLRKDVKDKSKDEAPAAGSATPFAAASSGANAGGSTGSKKDKRSTGLRGIRGLVG